MQTFLAFQNTSTDNVGFQGMVTAETVNAAAIVVAVKLEKRGYWGVTVENDTVYFLAWFDPEQPNVTDKTKSIYPTQEFDGMQCNTNYITVCHPREWSF
jgi:hypothetical protein